MRVLYKEMMYNVIFFFCLRGISFQKNNLVGVHYIYEGNVMIS